MIHEAALGGMRDTDGLASAALRDAARKKRKLLQPPALNSPRLALVLLESSERVVDHGDVLLQSLPCGSGQTPHAG
jgi:hypothetical protein